MTNHVVKIARRVRFPTPSTSALGLSSLGLRVAHYTGRFSGLAAAKGGASGQPFRAGHADDLNPLPQPVLTGFPGLSAERIQRCSPASCERKRATWGAIPQRIAVVLAVFSSIAGSRAQVHPPTASSGDTRVDEILTALQDRSDGLRDIRCDVGFVEEDQVNLTKRTKRGRIQFLITEPNPHFLIHFAKTETDGVLGKQEWYLFDGNWLHQVLERVEQITKQEVARRGEKIDLFDLEKAPFPLPFGQKKEKILSNFEVRLAPASGSDPANSDHLVCVPKADSRLRRRYDKLELFVDRSVHLPRRIVVTKSGGMEINTADFPDLSDRSINAGVTERDFDRPAAWKKYKEVVEELIPNNEEAP